MVVFYYSLLPTLPPSSPPSTNISNPAGSPLILRPTPRPPPLQVSVAILYASDYGFSDRLSQTLARGITKAGVQTEMVDVLSADPQVGGGWEVVGKVVGVVGLQHHQGWCADRGRRCAALRSAGARRLESGWKVFGKVVGKLVRLVGRTLVQEVEAVVVAVVIGRRARFVLMFCLPPPFPPFLLPPSPRPVYL